MSDQDFAEAVDQDRLAEERSLHQQTMAERDRLRDRVFELRIYEGFGQDHGHQRCIAEIARLTRALETQEAPASSEEHGGGSEPADRTAEP